MEDDLEFKDPPEPQSQPDIEIKEEWGEDISPDNNKKVFKTILQEGSGDARPSAGDEVYVHYTGKLLDGTVFDSSVARNEQFKFQLGKGKVIKGWDVGVATMRKGEKCILTCMPDYAYGESGSGSIPPNAVLQFEVELFRWHGEDVTKDGGVYISFIHKSDNYSRPSDGSTVEVHLKGCVGDHVIEDRDVAFVLGEGSESDVILGVEKAIEKMGKTEVAVATIAPLYAFGADGDAGKGVPPKAEVTYTITLNNFEKMKSSYEYDDIEMRLADAGTIKEKGSVYFKAGKYDLALKVYQRGLTIVEKSSVYKEEEKEQSRPIRIAFHLNLAACYLKTGEATEAIKMCDEVLEEDKENVKGHFRKGQAYQGTKEYSRASACFQEVIKLEPGNKAARQQVQVCREKIKEEQAKDKKFYSNMFRKMDEANKRESKNEPKEESVKENGEESPVKDAVTRAVEEAEKAEKEAENMVTEPAQA